jgi:hypothetical protein
MSGARNYFKPVFRVHRQARDGPLIEPKDLAVLAADDEETGRVNVMERHSSEIGPASARHNSLHDVRPFGGGNQRRGSARARAKTAEAEISQYWLAAGPIRDADEALRQERDVEAQFGGLRVDAFFFGGEEVREDGSDTAGMERFGNMAVARAVSAAPASMGEKHNASGLGWYDDVGEEGDIRERYLSGRRHVI